tara:strand:- start:667 stop:1008 length:342 start_codon:yes stop_codon:yes gene_type:complete
MSTYYRPTRPLPLQRIKDSKFLQDHEFDVVEDDNGTYFTCGGHCVHYATDRFNYVIDLFRYGGNNPNKILDPLSDEFEVDFVSEHDEEYDDFASNYTNVMTISFANDDEEQDT